MNSRFSRIKNMAAFLHNKTNEFAKLDEIDRMTCLELLATNPKAINAWVDYMTTEYQRMDRSFSGRKLKEEITEFQKFLNDQDKDSNDISTSSN